GPAPPPRANARRGAPEATPLTSSSLRRRAQRGNAMKPTLKLVVPTDAAPKAPRVKRLASGGYSVRIRFGQARAKRITLPAAMTPPEAAARAALLAELGGPLGKLEAG